VFFTFRLKSSCFRPLRLVMGILHACITKRSCKKLFSYTYPLLIVTFYLFRNLSEGLGLSRARASDTALDIEDVGGRQQGQINGALDMATDLEVIGAKRPGNVRAKGCRIKEAGTSNVNDTKTETQTFRYRS
jgi:hypothetical protein